MFAVSKQICHKRISKSSFLLQKTKSTFSNINLRFVKQTKLEKLQKRCEKLQLFWLKNS